MIVTILGVQTQISMLTLVLAGILLLDSYLYLKRMLPKDGFFRLIPAGIILALLTTASVVLHEFSHGLVAAYFKIPIVGAGLTWWGHMSVHPIRFLIHQ